MADVKEKHLWGHRPESEEDVCYKVLNNDGAKFIQGKWVSECLSSRGQLEEGVTDDTGDMRQRHTLQASASRCQGQKDK